MTDLIPRDAAINAMQMQLGKGKEQWMQGNNSAINACCAIARAIPTIDPAAIREAALREALKALDNLPEYGSPDVNIGVSNAYSAILALIGEKK